MAGSAAETGIRPAPDVPFAAALPKCAPLTAGTARLEPEFGCDLAGASIIGVAAAIV